MIKACPFINKFEKKNSWWSVHAPLESFSFLLWNSEFFYESAVVSLPIRYDSFWYAVEFTEQQCLFDKRGFLHKQYCGHKRIKIVFSWIAGGVYWTAVAFTNMKYAGENY